MTKFDPQRVNVERLPKSWKYRLTQTSELRLSSVEHKLYIPNGHVQLVSERRNCVMADIFVDQIIAHDGLLYDGSTGAIDWTVMQRGAAFHDILCESVDRGLIGPENQPIADRIMRDVWMSDAVFVARPLRGVYRADVRLRYVVVRAYQRRQHGF